MLFFRNIQDGATCRPEKMVVQSMGKRKIFRAYDIGADTVVFERDVWRHMDDHASVLVAEKGDLVPGATGHVMTSPYAAATDATTANANTVFLLIDTLLCLLRVVYQKPFPLTIANCRNP